MENQTPRIPPTDVRETIAFLRWMRSELEDTFTVTLEEELLPSFDEDVKAWRAGGAEPDWQSYREWINSLCCEHAYPALFKVQHTEE